MLSRYVTETVQANALLEGDRVSIGHRWEILRNRWKHPDGDVVLEFKRIGVFAVPESRLYHRLRMKMDNYR